MHNFGRKIPDINKTSTGILQFLRYDWLTGNGICALIPLTTNIVAATRQWRQLGSRKRKRKESQLVWTIFLMIA